MIVVKIGGSLYDAPELQPYLAALADYSTQQSIVIVPGGGPFADQVRHAQTLHHFDDHIAHHMAIIAMKQFGLLLSSLIPTCQLIHGDQPPTHPFSIWLPDDTLLSKPDLKKSWDISSDSIALWLAGQLDAEQLLLIKRPLIDTTSIEKLTLDSVLDNGFATLFRKNPIHTKIIHYQAHSDLADIISQSNNVQGLQLP